MAASVIVLLSTTQASKLELAKTLLHLSFGALSNRIDMVNMVGLTMIPVLEEPTRNLAFQVHSWS